MFENSYENAREQPVILSHVCSWAGPEHNMLEPCRQGGWRSATASAGEYQTQSFVEVRWHNMCRGQKCVVFGDAKTMHNTVRPWHPKMHSILIKALQTTISISRGRCE